MQWFEDSFFLFSVKRYDRSIARQNVNTKKIYCIDHGMTISAAPSIQEKKGSILENIIFIHLKQISKEIYYYHSRTAKEVDFLWIDNKNKKHLIQVCYNLDDIKTKEREITSLIEAMNNFNLNEGTIITFNEDKTIKINKKTIKIIPAWRYLIQ